MHNKACKTDGTKKKPWDYLVLCDQDAQLAVAYSKFCLIKLALVITNCTLLKMNPIIPAHVCLFPHLLLQTLLPGERLPTNLKIQHFPAMLDKFMSGILIVRHGLKVWRRKLSQSIIDFKMYKWMHFGTL